jgi:hypothetical protein
MRISAGSASIVRDLTNRILGTGVTAVLMAALRGVVLLGVVFFGAGLMPASARAGGLAGGGVAGQSLVRPGQMPPVVVTHVPAPVRRFGFEPAREHRRFFGFGLPFGGPALVPFYGPIADVGPIAQPQVLSPLVLPVAGPEGSDRSPANGPDCRSETRMVSSEAGGERPIKITRCRGG